MNDLIEAGRYRASVKECGVSRTDSNICVAVVFLLIDNEQDNEWVECDPKQITGWYYLLKKGGELNEISINQLREALFWDGVTLEWFQEAQTFPDVQIVIAEEEYQGRKKMKVQWLRPYDWTGGIVKSSEAELKSIQREIGSKLRALSGTPANPPTIKPVPEKPVLKLDKVYDIFYVRAVKAGMQSNIIKEVWEKAWDEVVGDSKDANDEVSAPLLECLNKLIEVEKRKKSEQAKPKTQKLNDDEESEKLPF